MAISLQHKVSASYERRELHCAHVPNGAARDHDVSTRGSNSRDGILHALLLALCVVTQVGSVLQHDVALGLRGPSLDAAPEHSHLGVLNVLHGPERVTLHDDALHHLGVAHGAANDLAHAHVVDVDGVTALGHNGNARLGNKWGEEVLEAVLLGGDHRLQRDCKLGHVTGVLDSVHDFVCIKRRTSV